MKHRLPHAYRSRAHTKLNSPHAHLNSASYKHTRACVDNENKRDGERRREGKREREREGVHLRETRVNVCDVGRMSVSGCRCAYGAYYEEYPWSGDRSPRVAIPRSSV